MCGLVMVKRKDKQSVVRPLIKRYEQQKHRGTSGYGFVAVKDGKLIGYERAKHYEEIEKLLKKYDKADEIMFHHRIPTSTPNLAECAHPIKVSNPKLLKHDYYLVHNGVISNDTMLKKKHEELGFKYTTEIQEYKTFKTAGKTYYEKTASAIQFNDSETLAIEFALFNEGLEDTVSCYGSQAFICYEVDRDTNDIIALHYGHNTGNPLKITNKHGMFVLSSESKDGEDVEVMKVCSINSKSKEANVRPFTGYCATSPRKYEQVNHSHGWPTHADYYRDDDRDETRRAFDSITHLALPAGQPSQDVFGFASEREQRIADEESRIEESAIEEYEQRGILQDAVRSALEKKKENKHLHMACPNCGYDFFNCAHARRNRDEYHRQRKNLKHKKVLGIGLEGNNDPSPEASEQAMKRALILEDEIAALQEELKDKITDGDSFHCSADLNMNMREVASITNQIDAKEKELEYIASHFDFSYEDDDIPRSLQDVF